MGYKFKIEVFEGPLDLLLHLLKEAKLDIYEIKISEITQQYLGYIHAMEQLELEIASEYLVMAATLIEIKSKSLLPKRKVDIDAEYEEDTRESLIQRLVDYQKYKQVTKEFRELEEARGQFYTKPPIDFTPYFDSKLKLPKQNYQVEQLISAFEQLMRRHKLMQPLKTRIISQNISVQERMISLKKQLKYKKKMAFSLLFQSFDRELIIITFLALLELVKGRDLVILQENNQEDIYISSLEGDEVV